jgi:predicted MFS family arabinose efflux permease
MEAFGWRATLGIYAGLHLLICLPIHLFLIPRKFGVAEAARVAPDAGNAAVLSSARFRWLTVSFAIATFVFSVFAVHIVTLMTQAGLTTAQAVALSILVGPMQVLGRLVELSFSKRIRATTMGVAAFSLMLLSLAALLIMSGPGIAPILFVVAFGCGNGLLTIIRGIAPAELFGRVGFGKMIGYLSRATLYSKALAPASFSAMLAIGLSHQQSLVTLAVLATLAFASYGLAIRPREA